MTWYNGRPKGRERSSEELRALREKELADAQAAADASPDDEAAHDRLVSARKSHGLGLSLEQYDEREKLALELLVEHDQATAAKLFAEKTGLVISGAYRWFGRALASRSPPVEVARLLAASRLEVLSEEARKSGDMASAVRATVAAARMRGVAEKVEVSATVVSAELSPMPPEIQAELLALDESDLVAWLQTGRRPPAPAPPWANPPALTTGTPALPPGDS